MKELLGFALHQPPNGHARPRRNNLGDLIGVHVIGDHRLGIGAPAASLRGLSRRDLGLNTGNVPVLDPPGIFVAALAYRQFELRMQLI